MWPGQGSTVFFFIRKINSAGAELFFRVSKPEPCITHAWWLSGVVLGFRTEWFGVRISLTTGIRHFFVCLRYVFRAVLDGCLVWLFGFRCFGCSFSIENDYILAQTFCRTEGMTAAKVRTRDHRADSTERILESHPTLTVGCCVSFLIPSLTKD